MKHDFPLVAGRMGALALLCGFLALSAACNPATHRVVAAPEVPLPRIDSLLPLRFARIRGPETAGVVLDVGPAGSWSASWVGLPTVVFDGTRYLMWYDGTPMAEPGESPYLYKAAIGFATSTDGLHWTVENSGAPVFEHGPAGSFDQFAVSHPFVMRVDHHYWMWYAGADGTQGPNEVRVERIGLAKSPDGMHWTRANGGKPVVNIGNPGSIDTIQAAGPCVLFARGQFMMWYAGARNFDRRRAGRTLRVFRRRSLPDALQRQAEQRVGDVRSHQP